MHPRNTIFLKDKIKIEGLHQINDYEYDWYGNRIAVSDSDGNIVIYQKDAEGKFKYSSSFKGGDNAIWKISWAHPKCGDLIGVASFSKKVSVWMNRNNEWTEIAQHTLHEGSVNEVKWAPYYYGHKLFACSSDGNFSVLEVRGNSWYSKLFQVKELGINTIAVEKKSLLTDTENLENQYPLIATGGKDRKVLIWKYNKGEYQQLGEHIAHKDAVRNILWRKPVTTSEDLQIFSCSEDGTVKLLTFKSNGPVKQQTIWEGHQPILRLSQSLTGNAIIASVQDPNKSVVLRESPSGEWIVADNIQS